jgi:flavin reductase (DIM6/NTAB) family NADH-FMN oxidoreductase RutF
VPPGLTVQTDAPTAHPSDLTVDSGCQEALRIGGECGYGKASTARVSGSNEDLAAFFDLIDYPYYIVTVRSPEAEMSGCLAGFVTQCSIDPPNFLVCISKVNHTFGVAERSPGMGLHLLGGQQVDLARLFGEETGDVVDKFASVDWRLGVTGAPLLVDAAVSMEGQVLGHFSVGDHEAFVMRGVRAVAGGHSGLLTFRSAPPFHPGHPA